MKTAAGILLIFVVIAQPAFGYRAIPEFFNQNIGAAVLIGAIDGLMVFAATLLLSSN